MNFTMTLKREDYIYFNDFYLFKRRWKKNIIILIVISILFIGCDLIGLSVNGNSFGLSKFLGTFVLILTVYYLLIFLFVHNKVTTMITTSPDLIEKKEVTTDESGISINGEINKEFIKWEGFVDFIETKSHFILFNTILSAIILPKEFIEKEGLLDDMRHLLKSKSDQLNIKYTTFI